MYNLITVIIIINNKSRNLEEKLLIESASMTQIGEEFQSRIVYYYDNS